MKLYVVVQQKQKKWSWRADSIVLLLCSLFWLRNTLQSILLHTWCVFSISCYMSLKFLLFPYLMCFCSYRCSRLHFCSSYSLAKLLPTDLLLYLSSSFHNPKDGLRQEPVCSFAWKISDIFHTWNNRDMSEIFPWCSWKWCWSQYSLSTTQIFAAHVEDVYC